MCSPPFPPTQFCSVLCLWAVNHGAPYTMLIWLPRMLVCCGDYSTLFPTRFLVGFALRAPLVVESLLQPCFSGFRTPVALSVGVFLPASWAVSTPMQGHRYEGIRRFVVSCVCLADFLVVLARPIAGAMLPSEFLPLPLRLTFWLYIQGVPGGMCQTSGECSLC